TSLRCPGVSLTAWPSRSALRDPSRPPPAAAVSRDELVRLGRTHASRRIVRKVSRRKRLPHVEDGRGDVPGRLDHIGAVKEGGVADHAVVEQALVAGGRRGIAEILVAEVELDRIELDRRSRPLGLDLDLDSLLRLD